MDEALRDALARGDYIDITTTGRRTGEARRIELVAHLIDDRIYISGLPSRRRRSWIANLEDDARLTFHLKVRRPADLPATARIIDDETERRAIIPTIAATWRRQDIEAMVRYSPLIEVLLDTTAGN